MSLKKNAFLAFLWDLLGKLAEQGSGFFISIILARLLLPEDFGIVAMVFVILALAQSLVDMGLSTALIQKNNLNKYHFGSVFYFNITSGLTLTILFYFSAPYVAEFYQTEQLKPIFEVLSFVFFIRSFGNVQRAWLRKNLKYNILSFSNVAGVILGGSVGVYLAYKSYGVWALVVQSLVSAAASNLVIYFFAGWKPNLVFSLKALKELWGFGFKMFLSSLLSTTTNQLDNLIIGKLFTSTDLGLFNRAKTFNAFIIRYTSGSLMSILFPVLSKIKDNTAKYTATVFKAFHMLNYLVFLLLGILFFAIEDIIVLLFSEKWIDSVVYFKIMLLSGYAYPLSALIVNILASRGKSSKFLKVELIKQIINLSNLIFGFFWGIEVFLYIKAITSFVNYNINLYYSAKEIGKNILDFHKISTKYIMLNVLIFSIVYAFNQYTQISHNFLHAATLSFIYLALYFGFSSLVKIEAFSMLMKEFVIPTIKKIRK